MSDLLDQLCRLSPLNIAGSDYLSQYDMDFIETQNPLSLIDDVPSVKRRVSKRTFNYHTDGYIVLTPQKLKEIKEQPKLSEDTCLSFDEWRESGYYVKAGSKSQFRDALGIPQFTIEQVI